MKPWNIKQLKREIEYHISQCTTESELSMAKAHMRMEVKAMAKEITDSGRKLTPGEQSILDNLG